MNTRSFTWFNCTSNRLIFFNIYELVTIYLTDTQTVNALERKHVPVYAIESQLFGKDDRYLKVSIHTKPKLYYLTTSKPSQFFLDIE